MINLYDYYFEYDVYEDYSYSSIMTDSEGIRHLISRRFLIMPNSPLSRIFINREIEIKTKYLLDMENAI